MTRILSILVAVLSTASLATASTCPVLPTAQLKCQETVAKAGAGYTKSALGAIQKCLQAVQSGALMGDPATLCLGTPPTDPSTADKLAKAEAKVAASIPKKCTDADVASLQLCAPTATGLAACLVSDARARIGAALDAEYGTLVPNADKDVQKCQQTLGKEGAKFLNGKLKAVQKCLNTRNKKGCGTPDPVLRCLAPQADGPKDEAKAATAITKAETKLRDKILKSCTDAQVAALDACDDTAAGAAACLTCSHGNAADLLTGGQYRAVRVATPAGTFQAAANAAEADDTILLEPGTYTEEVTLKDSGLTVKGLQTCDTGARALVLPPSETSQNGVYHCGSRLLGCPDVADNVLLQGFEVNNFDENDVYTVGVVGITYRDMVTRGPGISGVTRYGLFPILSDGVLIDDCLATGISDAGLYVGQSINIVVRNSEVHSSVAGIEIENSANAEVHDNYAHDNAGGLLVFKLAGLPVQDSNCHYIHDNVATNNNGPNYGEGIVGSVPSGTGMLVLSNDSGIFENNTMTGNNTFGFVVIDQMVLNAIQDPDPFPTPSPNQDVNDNAMRGNTITGNGSDPAPGNEDFAGDVVFLPSAQSGNCQDGNTFATDFGAFFAGLPACPASISPRPGCPIVPPPTTTTITTTTTPTTTSTSSTLPWTFAAQVQPLLGSSCGACHGGGGTPQYAGLKDLDNPALAYGEIVNVPSTELPAPPNPGAMDRVEPGDSLESYLMHKIDGTQLDPSVGGSGVRMPQFGPYLSAADADGVRGWINAGALNN